MIADGRLRDGARQVMAWLHGWVGLLLGWLLYAMCLAGTLALFRPEIGQWARPENRAVAPPAEAVARTAAWLGRHAPTAPAWFLLAPTDRTNTVDATWADGATFVRRTFDPATGLPVVRDTLGGDFFYRLHFELQLPYPWGRLLASAAAMALLVALVTGVIAHRRIFRDFFTFRPGRGQRAWLDAHNALGVLSLPFHVMITLTGLLTLATLAMPWGITANYGSDSARMFADLTPGGVERPATGRKVPLAPLAETLRDAERRFGGAGFWIVTVSQPGDAAATVAVSRLDRKQATRIDEQLVYDGPSGRLLTHWAEHGRPPVAAYNVLYGLHTAHFAGGLLRWLYALGGAMLAGAIATGLVLWIVKRRARAPLSHGNRLVERINVGVIAGTPVAFVAFFLANRLIAPMQPGRADEEVAAVFLCWAAMLAIALVLPPRRAWVALLTTGAAAALAVPLVGLASATTALPAMLARHAWAPAGVDGTMILLAIALAWASWKASRGTHAPARRTAIAPVLEPA